MDADASLGFPHTAYQSSHVAMNMCGTGIPVLVSPFGGTELPCSVPEPPVRVSPSGGRRLPHPFGYMSGSRAQCESGFGRDHGACADMCTGRFQPPESARIGAAGNGRAARPSTFICTSICADRRFSVKNVGLECAIASYVRPGASYSYKSSRESSACASTRPNSYSKTVACSANDGQSAWGYQCFGCQTRLTPAPTFAI